MMDGKLPGEFHSFQIEVKIRVNQLFGFLNYHFFRKKKIEMDYDLHLNSPAATN